MNELQRIEHLARRFAHSVEGLEVGIGDDAAVIALGGSLVTTVDVAVEGVHFRRSFAPLDRLARRAFHAAVSDLAAMGAAPRGALSSLILPGSLPDDDFVALIDGLAGAADELGCPIIGGNLSAGGELSITTTALGVAHRPALTRAGARPGDILYVTGSPGDRALGLALLLREAPLDDADARALAEAWIAPTARLSEGQALVGLATAAVDISDGLMADLTQLADASGVGAIVDVDVIPHHASFARIAAFLGLDPLTVLVTGGEAYELLFTAPEGADVGAVGVPIGRVVAERGVALRRGDQAIEPRAGGGFQHFR